MLGGITLVLWAIRIFAFDLLESPRYLIGKGKDEEAVAVIHKVAAHNKNHVVLDGGPVDLDRTPHRIGKGCRREMGVEQDVKFYVHPYQITFQDTQNRLLDIFVNIDLGYVSFGSRPYEEIQQ